MTSFLLSDPPITASDILLEPPPDHDDDVPQQPLFGLWISWDGQRATFTLVPDQHLAHLHPNIYAPAALQNTRLLKGGGSGTPVFRGNLLDQELVWKHGDHRDVGEVFGLARMEQELQNRSLSPDAAQELRDRIPQFKGLYLSPHHIRIRSHELWTVVKKAVTTWSLDDNDDLQHHAEEMDPKTGSGTEHQHSKHTRRRRRSTLLCSGSSNGIRIQDRHLRISLRQPIRCNNEITCNYESLVELVENLQALQKKHFWKFSIAQSCIGGSHPQTASYLYTSGQLQNDRLHLLLDQFLVVLRALQQLAHEQERDVVDQIQQEVAQLKPDATAADVSPLANAYVGLAIHKNFDMVKGRFRLIRESCLSMKDGTLLLRPEEELPGQAILQRYDHGRAIMARLFRCEYIEMPSSDDLLYAQQQVAWRNLLQDAVQLKSPAATQRIWTCGLTDAGIHNMFFSLHDETACDNLWLFDLGEPDLQPIPAFLTKFLMSFFHTLGMEETDDGTSWVNRFEPDGDSVRLTQSSQNLLPRAYETFNVVLDRLVTDLFDGEEAVQSLLVKYVALQLVSDCAFCMERWQRKGGGSPSYGNHQKGLEKWLWRALWDVHVFTDLCDNYAPPGQE